MAQQRKTAKAAKAKAPTQDRHQDGYMVRLPERYREFFRLLAEENSRTATAEILLCLNAGIEQRGLKVPPKK